MIRTSTDEHPAFSKSSVGVKLKESKNRESAIRSKWSVTLGRYRKEFFLSGDLDDSYFFVCNYVR